MFQDKNRWPRKREDEGESQGDPENRAGDDQAPGGQQDGAGSNRRSEKEEVWRGWRVRWRRGRSGRRRRRRRRWWIFQCSCEGAHQACSPERRDVPDGTGERPETLKPAVQVVLQLIEASISSVGASREFLWTKWAHVMGPLMLLLT